MPAAIHAAEHGIIIYFRNFFPGLNLRYVSCADMKKNDIATNIITAIVKEYFPPE
jgi:hypothetical protein